MKKTKNLQPLPSFSFGLTQMEEEQRNVTASSSGKEKKQHIKKHKKKNQRTEAHKERSSNDENAKQRLRYKMSIRKVYELMHSVHCKRRK